MLPVAACAAGLLIVGFQAAGNVIVDHRADVGLIDAHAEGVRGNDDFAAAVHEGVLSGAALVGQHAGMVHGNAALGLGREQLGDFFGAFSSRCVDDARAGRFAEKLQKHFGFLAFALRGKDLVKKVGPFETGDEGSRLVEIELFDNVAADVVGGGGGQSNGGGIVENPPEITQPGVIGTKIVPPLTDAVRLVDGQQFYSHRPHGVDKLAGAESFGHDVGHPIFAGSHAREPVVLLGKRNGAVDKSDRQSQGVELIDLVFHQGDKRRNDKG